MINITRRRLLGSLGAGTAAAGLGMLPATAQGRQLTFVSWGGTTQDAQKTAWADPFTAKTGIRVLQDGPTDYGKLRAQVESGNVSWDIVDCQGPVALQLAKAGMLEPIDFSVVKKDNLDPRFTFSHGVGSFYSSYVLAWNKDALKGNVPASWADMFDTKKFPGKRALYKWMSAANFEIALMADGVPADKLYPLDIERAYAKLNTIKKDVIFWGTGAQSQQLLASGETPLGLFWSGRVYSLVADGVKNVDFTWKQSTPGTDILVVPKGSKNKDIAMQFMALASQPEPQAHMANLTAYAPINSEANKFLKPELKRYMPFGNNDSEVTLDLQYLADNWADLSKRWYAWQSS